MKKKTKVNFFKELTKSDWRKPIKIGLGFLAVLVVVLVATALVGRNGKNLQTSLIGTMMPNKSGSGQIIAFKDFTPLILCSFDGTAHNKPRCKTQRQITIDGIPYDGTYDIVFRVKRGNQHPPYECQSHESFEVSANGLSENVALAGDPDNCEPQNTRKNQTIRLNLAKGRNVLYFKHAWAGKGGIESLTIESMVIVPRGVVGMDLQVDDVCVGDSVHIVGQAATAGIVDRIVAHRIVKGNNCFDNSATIHWSQAPEVGEHNWDASNPNKIEVDDSVNFAKIGTYTIGYTTWGKSGNKVVNTGCVNKTFRVKDCAPSPPVHEMKCGPAHGRTDFTSTPQGDDHFFCDTGEMYDLRRYYHNDQINKWDWYCRYPWGGTRRCWAEGPVTQIGCASGWSTDANSPTVVTEAPSGQLCSDNSTPNITHNSFGNRDTWQWTCGQKTCYAAKEQTITYNFDCPYYRVYNNVGYVVDFGDNINNETGFRRTAICSNCSNTSLSAREINGGSKTTIPAGRYMVRLFAFDGYSGRRYSSQSHERYHVTLGGVQTEDSGDVPDGQDTAHWDGIVNGQNNPINLTRGVNLAEISAHHTYSGQGDSVVPICAWLFPVDDNVANDNTNNNTSDNHISDNTSNNSGNSGHSGDTSGSSSDSNTSSNTTPAVHHSETGGQNNNSSSSSSSPSGSCSYQGIVCDPPKYEKSCSETCGMIHSTQTCHQVWSPAGCNPSKEQPYTQTGPDNFCGYCN